jgi:hypothetical protein
VLLCFYSHKRLKKQWGILTTVTDMSKRRQQPSKRLSVSSKLGVSSHREETEKEEIEPGKVACPICGKTFNLKSEMERHKETAHEELEGHNY